MPFRLLRIAVHLARSLFGNGIAEHTQRTSGPERLDVGFTGALEIIEAVERIGDRNRR